MSKRIVVVAPRPPRVDGQGDQRRAHEIVAALSSEWPVDVVSWMPDADRGRRSRWVAHPLDLARAVALALRLPAQVAYVQGRGPRSLANDLRAYDLGVFVTARAVPPGITATGVVDFVDDLGGQALRRADMSTSASAAFWRWEGSRMSSSDRNVARYATVAVACSPADAEALGDNVVTVPLSVGTSPLPESGTKVTFMGNLFYAPNHEAALWICRDLVPALAERGVGPGNVLLAGRRPHPAVCEAAAAAGVDFRPDVPDLNALLGETAVVIAPMRLGSGAQYKVLDAVGANRPCVITARANAAFGLVDGRSALIRERTAAGFADAITTLLDDRSLRERLVAQARIDLAGFMPEAVADSWRRVVRAALAK